MSTLAKNTVIKISDMAVTPALTQILGVTVIKWAGRKWSTEKTTSHDNAIPIETMVTTLASNGDVQLTILWDSANPQHAALKALSISGQPCDFEVIQVDTASDDTFSAYCSAFGFDTPVDGELKANVTLSISGPFA